jgi:hypothetical protein
LLAQVKNIPYESKRFSDAPQISLSCSSWMLPQIHFSSMKIYTKSSCENGMKELPFFSLYDKCITSSFNANIDSFVTLALWVVPLLKC